MATSTDLRTPGFSVVTPEELEERFDAVPLYPGITAYPVVWSDRRDGDEPPTIREAYVRFDADAGYPEVDHHTDSRETVLVMNGILVDERGAYAPGTRIEGERGSSHTPSSPTGCLIYVMFGDR